MISQIRGINPYRVPNFAKLSDIDSALDQIQGNTATILLKLKGGFRYRKPKILTIPITMTNGATPSSLPIKAAI